jgi:sterol desaturase/sphingolipid hydroxylase (fatty acid hydroxylase superfamily)
MIKLERSLTRTLISFTIGLVITLMVGVILAWLMPWLFYELNPIISMLIASTGWPYQDLFMKVGWFGSSFVIGILLAMLFNFPIQAIRARIARRAS